MICPKCGADQDTIFPMMEEGCESENFQIAVKIIMNCEECRQVYRSNMEWLSNNNPAGVKGDYPTVS